MDQENKYGTLAIQESLLRLLKAFDAFCNQHQIKYSLSGGSLLGAVRHHGFIPWDDDLDCVMDRSNYRKFSEAIKSCDTIFIDRLTSSSLWIDRLRLRECDYSGSYLPTMDIFVYDNCPDNPIRAKIKMLFIKMLQGMIKNKADLTKGSLLLKLCSLGCLVLGYPFSYATKRHWFDKVSQWWNGSSSRFVKIYNDQYFALKTLYPSNVMDINKIVRLPFEDTMVNGLAEYDRYLTLIYGDYMTPPVENKRVPQHL